MSNKDCGHSVPCGCDDQALTGPPPCEQGTPNCPDPDPCPETFRAQCVVWTNDDLQCDSTVLATSGDRLPLILERLVALFCTADEVPTITTNIICGEDIVVAAGATYEEAFNQVVAYFCTRLSSIDEAILDLQNYTPGLFAQTANSATATDPVLGNLIGAGVGSVTVPENTFQVGDSYRLKMSGHITCTNTQELTILVRSNGVTLASTGLIDLKTATDSHWLIEIDFTIRSIGAGGSLVSAGTWQYIADSGGQNLEGENFSDVSSIDTTVSNTLEILASWNLDEGGANSMFSELFTLTKTY